ncbi:MAG: hypothetical protein EBQ92_08880 [Proteobacteria bacterium]|nr:hypothetical protein [Pseudomonadota bacterium]
MARTVISRRTPIFLGPVCSTPFQRCIAKGIDLVLVMVVFFVGKTLWGPLGPLLGACYAAVQDSFSDGQSVGKRIIGLRTLDEGTGIACSAAGSCMRNLPLVLTVLCATIPVVWAFVLLAALSFVFLEIYLIFSLETGVRLGDVMANTLIVEHFELHPEEPVAPL